MKNDDDERQPLTELKVRKSKQAKVMPVFYCVILILVIPALFFELWGFGAKLRVTNPAVVLKSDGGCDSAYTNSTSTNSKVIPAPQDAGYIRYPKIFGHLHYAKTAGSEIGGELAAHFERVCGNKGYSYDATQVNRRVANALEKLQMNSNSTVWPSMDKIHSAMGQDAFSKADGVHDRGNIPYQFVKEIGFEDCDYITLERPAKSWESILSSFHEPKVEMELHVPCREPLSHLMSQCNFKRHAFKCKARDLESEVKKCLVMTNRFDKSLLDSRRLDLKCFNPIPIDPYLEYMGQHLQRKRFETNYVHRETNRPRNKTAECIWQDKKVQSRVVEILLKQKYYSFCNSCMADSTKNLLM